MARPASARSPKAGCGNLCPSVGRGCHGCFGLKAPQPSGIAGQEGRFGHGQPQIEEDLHRTVSANLALPDEDLKWLCEQTIRNDDPCICCATHFLKLTVERG